MAGIHAKKMGSGTHPDSGLGSLGSATGSSMTDWFEGLGGPEFATAVIWTFAALILLVIVLVIIRLVRSMTFGTFVSGGRNRKTRLAVMDATAVDSHRRLVLVRRDDIEHLLLIGGPTDVVVEREIRMAPARRNHSVFGNEAEAQAPAPVPLPPLPTTPQAIPPRQRAPEPAHMPPAPTRGGAQQPARQPERAPQPAVARQPAAQPARVVKNTGAYPPAREQAPSARSIPPRLPPAALPASSPANMSATTRPTSVHARSASLDDALLRELEVTFEAGPPRSYDPSPVKSVAKPVEMTLDDEMTKLLGELSNNKR